MPPRERSPFQLLVEGIDDKWSIINLMQRHGINWDDHTQPLPYVRDCQGAPNLIDNELKLILGNKTAYRVVGIVLDADDQLEARWSSLKFQLTAQGFDCPTSLPADGFVADDTAGRVRGGVWLMPDNRLPGNLETFLSHLVPTGDACWEYSETVVNEAKQRQAPFADKDRLKARLHTWLAWREEPGIPFGQALTQRCLGADGEIALRFVSWFRRLFGVPTQQIE